MKIMINGVTVDASPEQEACMTLLSTTIDAGTFNNTLQQVIDSTAQQKEYADGIACVSYVNSTNTQWESEAKSFAAWRDSVFAYGYDYQAKVQDGTIASPSIESFIEGIPVMIWPN